MPMWDDVKKNIVDWYGAASDKTGEMARVGMRRYDIFGISRDIERQFSEIGSLVFNAVKENRTDVLKDERLLDLVERVKILEAELAVKQVEINSIRKDRREKDQPEESFEDEHATSYDSLGDPAPEKPETGKSGDLD